MQCDQCGERPAAIHLTQIVSNSVTTVHLCEVCAAEKGVQTEAGAAKLPLADFLATVGKGAAGALPPGKDGGVCSSCGGTLQDFRETGRLGCPDCYSTFEPHLRTLLRRIHGSSRHMGSAYVEPHAEPLDRERMLRDLRDKLRRAVEEENFELAAELRDRIRGIE